MDAEGVTPAVFTKERRGLAIALNGAQTLVL